MPTEHAWRRGKRLTKAIRSFEGVSVRRRLGMDFPYPR
jgi:hypothetical protein